MAARLTRGTAKVPWNDQVRSRIKTSMLINRLHGLSEGKVEMPPHAVTAALGLLRKTLPDYSVVEHQGQNGGPIILRWEKALDGE